MVSVEKTAKIFSRINADGHPLVVYYTILPVVSLSIQYRVTHDSGGNVFIGDFAVPHNTIFAQFNPLDALTKMVENHIGVPVQVKPSEYEQKLEDYRNDPKNWPTQSDDDIGHPWGMHDDD